jgi:excisionase family DNA binding protein
VKSNGSVTPITPRLLRTSDAARYLNISPWKLRRLVHDAELPVIEREEGTGANWLFDRIDLDQWVEKHKRLLSL